MKGIRYKKGLLKRCFSLLLILAVVWSGVSAPVISFAESLSGTQEGAAVPQGESGTQGQNPEGIQATQSGGKNVTGLLSKDDNLKATILQDNVELGENSSIDPKKPLHVVLSFKVPVENDYSAGGGGEPDPLQIVKQGDYAKFKIAEGLDLSEDSAWKNLYFEDTTENKKIKVGEFRFITEIVNDKKSVFLELVFTANKDVNVQSETYDDINIFESYKGISVYCSASFKLEKLNDPQTPGETEQTITILDKDYTFTIAPPTEVALKKAGRVIINEPDNRAIEWTLDITGEPEGCELVDELSNVGEYVDGSFKIQYDSTTISTETPSYDNTTKKLSYTFSKNKLPALKAPVKVSFQTRLTPQEFRAGVEKAFYPENKLTKKENTAKLIKTEGGELKEKAVAKATVEWGPVWVTKKGEPVFDKDTQQHYIDWTITVNEKEKAVLENVVITDVLRKGLHEMTKTLYQQDFVEASLTIYDKDGEQVSTTNYNKDSNGVIQDQDGNKVKIDNTVTDVHGRAAVAFTFPTIEKLEGKAVLKLRSKVDRGSLSLGKFMGRDNRFYNDVKVTWKSNPPELPAIATANVGIGQRALTKSVAPAGIFATARVKNEHLKTYIKPVTTWNIKVQGAEITTDSAVYDMLIFDHTVTREDITGGKLTLGNGNTKVDGIEIKDFVPFEINGRIRYYQYMDGSFSSDNNSSLSAKAIPLYKDNKYVGDLLKVNGFKDKEDTSFTFQTRLMDPWLLVNPKEDIFTDEGASHTATNTVYIAKESRIFDTHTDYPRYISRMLEKETLTAAQGDTFIKDNKSNLVNSNIISETDLQGASFNHARRSILYRLSVNADKIQDMGTLTVKDELPTGWELKNYWIFRGESEIAYSSAPEIIADTEQNVEKTLKEKSHARVKATGAVILTDKETNETSDYVKVSVKEGEPLSFNFPNIQDAYVILIEAGPTAETLSKYLENPGNSHKVENKASLYLDSLEEQKIEKIQTTLVNLKQEIISKAYIYDPKKPGELKWYIDYIADGKSKEDDKLIIEDTLKKGIAVRFDSEGKLLYGEYKIVELGFDAEGKPTETAFDLDLKDYISYKKVRETGESEKEVLTFKVPNPIKSYRFYYITDITGNKGEEVENTVVLKKNTDKIAEHVPKKKYKILGIDASAKATRIATLEIIKVDSEDKKALAGAEFTLKKNDGSFEKTITTDKEGRAKIINLDPGDYILVETKAPKDYKLNKTEYKVTVTNNGSANVVKVGGKTGPLQVENTKDPTKPPAPPEKPDTPPVTPPGTPDTPPVTPPGNPFIPPADTVPDDPVPLPPTYPFDEIPDPNDPGSPDTIMVVDEDDTPLGIYEKKENPDGTFDYVVVDDKVPLDHIPKTGDRSYPIYFGFLFLLTIPVFMKKRKEL